MLKTFAIHLQAIDGSVGLKSFLTPESDDVDDLYPVGALVLSCIAVSNIVGCRTLTIYSAHRRSQVQRALKLYESGSCPKTVTDFSADQAIKEQHKFANFIKIKPSSWDKIILAAKEFVPSGIRRSSTRSQSRVASRVTETVATVRDDSDSD